MKHEMLIRKGNIELAKEVENLFKHSLNGEEIKQSCGNLGQPSDGVLLRKFQIFNQEYLPFVITFNLPYDCDPKSFTS